MKRLSSVGIILVGVLLFSTNTFASGFFGGGTTGGATTFLGLTDTPSAYTGQGGKTVTVKATVDGLEFTTPAGGGDMLAATFDSDADDDIDLAAGGTNASLTDPNADRIMFWDDAPTGEVTWLTASTGLTITGGNLTVDLGTAITSSEITDDEIVNADIKTTAAIAFSKLAALTDSYILVGNVTNVATAVNPAGDVEVGNDGATTIQANAVEESMLKAVDAASDEDVFTYESTTGDFEWHSIAEIIAQMAEGGLPNDSIVEADLKAVDAAADEDFLSYESTTGDFEWHSAAEIAGKLTEGQLPDSIIVSADIKDGEVASADITDNTITTTDLNAALTFADGDQIDLTAITYVNAATTNEGIALPTYVAGAAPADNKPYMAYDATNNAIMVYELGGWTDTSSGSGAATTLNFVTTGAEGSLSSESVLTAGNAIDITDAGGDGGAITVAFDPTEVSADGTDTWSDGSQASITWTFDVSGTDHTMVAGNGLMTFGDAVTVTDTLTATNGIALGTSKSIIATTGMTIGGGTETVAINSSDWDIDATGIMTGIGNITSDGVITSTGFTIGSAVITEAELEIIDGATLSTADINIIDGISDSGTLTAAELLYVDGVSSAIQTQLDARCLESVFGTALEADDLTLNGTTLELVAEIPHIDASQNISGTWEWQDGVNIVFGNDADVTLGYDETTDDRLELTTTLDAATGDEEAFAILYTTNKATSGDDYGLYINQTDTASPGTSYLIWAGVGGTGKFMVKNDGSIITAASADPAVVLDEVTALDTDYWFGINADQQGDDDDYFQIGTGTTVGSNVKWQLDNAGNVIAQGNITGDSFIMEGGTYDTTITPGTPTASVSYQWPLAAPVANGYALVSTTAGTMTWAEITATAGGSDTYVQYNSSGTLGGEAAFAYNLTNNTLSITQAASNPTLQIGDGTYSWNFTPQVGIEGILEVDSDIAVEDDIYMDSDDAVIWLGEDADVKLIHIADTGIIIKQVGLTTDDHPTKVTLQTGETDMALNDVLGGIYFQAPDEASGTDAILVAAGIEAVSEGDFSATSNATKLSFKTGTSETATEKMILSSSGNLTITGDITVSGGNINTGNIALTIGDTSTDSITLFGEAENLVFTPTADTFTVTSGTGVTSIDFQIATVVVDALTTSGTISAGGNLVLSANNITMTGSIADTTNRVLKGWFTDLEVTNAIAGSITGNAATVTTNANLTGEVTSVGNAATIADSITVTGWVLGTSSATQLTVGALAGVDSIDATGAVDMDYGSADVTDHTFTSDGGTVILDGSITLSADLTITGLDITADGTEEVISLVDVASAVNELEVTNSATNTPVIVGASGDDANIDLKLVGKGTGKAKTYTELQIPVIAWTTDATVADGHYYFHIGKELAGMNLVYVHGEVITAGTTGTLNVDLRNITQAGADILSTNLTIDTAETGSDTAAAPAVIDTAEDDMQENDLIAIDIDVIHTTASKGLIVTLGFELP